MKGYTNLTTIENYLLTEIDSSFVSQIEDWIGDMETYIDNYTGRNFIADTVATKRKYDGNNTSKLLIDDCVAITEVKIGDNTPLVKDESGEEDEYFLYPLNSEVINRIELASQYFPKYPRQSIFITGKWGYSIECPGDVRNACTILVAGIINYSNKRDGQVKSMSIGRYNVTYKDEQQWQDFERVKSILDYYKKFSIK